jgi:hypothetical protein
MKINNERIKEKNTVTLASHPDILTERRLERSPVIRKPVKGRSGISQAKLVIKDLYITI